MAYAMAVGSFSLWTNEGHGASFLPVPPDARLRISARSPCRSAARPLAEVSSGVSTDLLHQRPDGSSRLDDQVRIIQGGLQFPNPCRIQAGSIGMQGDRRRDDSRRQLSIDLRATAL